MKAVKESDLKDSDAKAAKPMSATRLVCTLASETCLTTKECKKVLDGLSKIAKVELAISNGCFLIPGICNLKRRTKTSTKKYKKDGFIIKEQCCKPVVECDVVLDLLATLEEEVDEAQ